MRRDIRQTALFGEVEALHKVLQQVGDTRIADLADLCVSADGQHAVFTGVLAHDAEANTASRICRVDLVSDAVEVLTAGPNTDRLPAYSPDGTRIAFLSDRQVAGNFQLQLLDLRAGTVQAVEIADGWVEALQWSPDGQRILLGVAGHGADVSGGQGAVTSRRAQESVPGWMPIIHTANEDFRWRSVWVYALESGHVERVSPAGLNVWEAVWCGPRQLALIASTSPSEGAWYTATLQVMDLASRECRLTYSPRDQLGCLSASPSGDYVAVVEALCSDRGIVAGDLLMIDPRSGSHARVDTNGVDITCVEWSSATRSLLAGHRGFETVILEHDVRAGKPRECWKSRQYSGGGRYIRVAPIAGPSGDCLFVREGFDSPPQIGRVQNGHYRTVVAFESGRQVVASESIHAVDPIVWGAPDGLEIQGWLLRPAGTPPYPVVMHVHGGPVWHWRPRWLGRAAASLADLMLLRRGYAVFYPNPRGSSGRGQEFAHCVKGDLGGAETGDLLSGLDHLVACGLADANRLGVTGGSHGGFMTSWLVTQDNRFAAAVPVASVTDRVSQYLTCAHSDYIPLFLADEYDRSGGRFFQRSPIMHARNVKTPTLHIAGALDRCTPPGQALEFHNALVKIGARSVLAIYPEEGHGISRFPASLDCASRVVAWFEEHMP